ncbi:MAG TPA: translational GTPase TypA [Polyangiales bacterium]|nr:translational GTPase TypA [Polyangiales bacterium]
MQPLEPKSLRNIAIIAHVDHGKTTLVDAILKQCGVYQAHEQAIERAMDSNDLERERGITILAKSTSVQYKDTRINIIDTPGHADFGGEVERTLLMADGALLLVDAAEGPLPQTRFVLKHALGKGMPVIVVVNKIDRKDARPSEVLNETFDLFCDLEATDAQSDFAVLYCIATRGEAHLELGDDSTDLTPLLDAIVERVPPPSGSISEPLQMIVTNIGYDEYVGRLAIGKIMNGQLAPLQPIMRLAEGGQKQEKVGSIYAFEGLSRVKREVAGAGDVVAVSGMPEVQIGDTLADLQNPKALTRISVEPPTIKVRFYVNSSPFAGKAGKFLTSRHLRERFEREGRGNLAMRFEDTDKPDVFEVYGRGEMMISILAETMRREGYEFGLGSPEVVVRTVDGVKSEPSERVVIDVPEEFVGTVTQSLGERRGRMDKMHNLGFGRARIEFVVPSRALIGYRSQFLTQTRGMGLLNSLHEGYVPYGGPMLRRKSGALVSDRTGTCTQYALFHLEPRGRMFVSPTNEVYEGMVVGEHNRPSDLDINPCKEKKLSNVREKNKDENMLLANPTVHTIETALEFIDQDEIIEITPDAVRIRKKVLNCGQRPKRTEESSS